jgi:hypothetical protein
LKLTNARARIDPFRKGMTILQDYF